MKKILSVLVILALAYAGYWFYEAYKIEKELTSQLASLGPHTRVVYDGIEKRGFPTHVELIVVNPKVEVDNEALRFTLLGNLSGRWSLLGKIEQLNLSGNSHVEFEIGEEGLLSDYSLDGNMAVEFDSLQTIGDQGRIILKNAKASSTGNDVHGPFECSIDSLIAKYDVKARNKEQSHLLLDVNFEGAKLVGITSEDETMLGKMYQVLLNNIEKKSGKTNASFTLQCELPNQEIIEKYVQSPLLLISEPFPSISIDLKNFASNNALVEQRANAMMSVSEDGKRRITAHVNADGFIHYFQGYHDAMAAAIDNMQELAKDWDAPQDLAIVKDVLINHADVVKNLIPHLENFGRIEGGENFFFLLNKKTFNWHMALEKLDLSCDLFALNVKADAQERNNSTIVDITVSITNAKRFTEELVSLYNKIEGVANLFEQKTKQHLKPLPENASEKILAYLNLLATKREQDLISINMIYRDGKIQIGPFSLEEARAEFEKLWLELVPPEEEIPVPEVK